MIPVVQKHAGLAALTMSDYTLDGYDVEILEQPIVNAMGFLVVKARASYEGQTLPDEDDHAHWFWDPPLTVPMGTNIYGQSLVQVNMAEALKRMVLESLLSSAKMKGWS